MGSRPGIRSGILASLLLLAACSSAPERPPDDAGSSAPGGAPATTSSPSSTPATSPAPSAHSDELPPYVATVRPIGPALRHRMRFSHRPGCPVPLADLRYLRMSYVGFDGRAHTGEMVVHEDRAAAVTQVFRSLYDARWPLRRMVLVDDYGGDDDRSMAANNTSGFNCRRVAGGDHWSDHAYGEAIDIDPVENPYVRPSVVQPPAGRPYAGLDRTAGADVPAGVIRSDDVVVRAFARIGWSWGGDWSTAKDYQHFSVSGG
jgi:poly-gamma-glutamate synthesis protein (capsule biosynthesis protein)